MTDYEDYGRQLDAEIDRILENPPPPEDPPDPQWDLAIAALLSESSIVRAADLVGVSERTLRRWLAEPRFQRLYREACRAVLAAARSRLVGLVGAATEALGRALTCGVPSVEARVAIDVIKLATDGAGPADLEARLSALEQDTRLAGWV
jgi:hypothetical protein